jgi:leucyl-tRNA synthetase
MVFLNTAEKAGLTQGDYELFLRLLAPFAPHLTEELWEKAGKTASIHLEAWPRADTSLTAETSFTIAVQINGKSRETITVAPGASQDEVMAITQANEAVLKRLLGQEIVKIIYVQDKILNLIVKPLG